MVARRPLILIVGAAAGTLLGLVIALGTARTFETAALLHLTPQPWDQSGMFTVPAVRQVLLGRDIVAGVVEQFQLTQAPHRLSPDRFRSEAYVVEEVPNTQLLRLKVRLRDPELAVRVTRAIADEAVRSTGRLAQESAAGRRTQLEGQVEQARIALGEAERRWLGYRQEAGLDLLRKEIDLLLARRDIRRTPQRSLLSDLYTKELEFVRLETEAETKRTVFIDASARHEELRLAIEASPPPLQLLEPPVLPERPLPSGRTRTVGLGFLAGLLVALLIVVIRDWAEEPEPSTATAAPGTRSGPADVDH